MGGAPIETFMSREMLSNYASDIEELDRCMDPAYVESVLKHDEQTTNEWYGTLDATDEDVIREVFYLCESIWQRRLR